MLLPWDKEDQANGDQANGAEAAVAPSADAAKGVLDSKALANLLATLGGDFANLSMLIDSFLEDAPQLMAELQHALDAGDAAEVRRVAHGLKSNGTDFGAAAFAGLCRDLETAGKAANMAEAAILLPQVQEAYAKVETELRAIRSAGRIL